MLNTILNRWTCFLIGRPFEWHDLLIIWNPMFLIPVLLSKLLDRTKGGDQ